MADTTQDLRRYKKEFLLKLNEVGVLLEDIPTGIFKTYFDSFQQQLDALIIGESLTEVTKAELAALKNTATMDYPHYYKITDMAEPLLLLATASGVLSLTAISPTYTEDIIHYNSKAVDETTWAIIYRKDRVKQLSAHYDWRTVTLQRWETALGSGIYTSATDTGGASQLFYTFGNDMTTYTPAADGSGGNNYSIKIGERSLNNVFDDTCYDITIGVDDTSITIGANSFAINIGSQCPAITIGHTNNFLDIGDNNGVTIGNSNEQITIGAENAVTVGNTNSYLGIGSNNTLTVGNSNDYLTIGNNNVTLAIGNTNGNFTIGNRNAFLSFGDTNSNVTVLNGNVTLTVGNSNANLFVKNSNNTVVVGASNNKVTIGASNTDITIGDTNSTITIGNSLNGYNVGNSNTGKRLEQGFSNFEATININNLTDIDLTGVEYAGIINLIDSYEAGTEQIDNILNASGNHPITFLAEGVAVADFRDASVGGGNLHLETSPANLDSVKKDTITFELRGTDMYLVNLKNYV